ncbi:MAG: YtxH domain-containing protein [Xenococcaceae cyanobacterium MO_188.B19]|nr:YtxH domain-containing protein [Xenococcaceae cyanobacterium MO_188.B19]
MSGRNRAGTFAGGLAIGAALGTIVGMLIAPRTGKETRKVLKKSADALPELAEDLSSTLQIQAHRLSDEALQNWESTLSKLKVAIAAGIEASQLERTKVENNAFESTVIRRNITKPTPNSSIEQNSAFEERN